MITANYFSDNTYEAIKQMMKYKWIMQDSTGN